MGIVLLNLFIVLLFGISAIMQSVFFFILALRIFILYCQGKLDEKYIIEDEEIEEQMRCKYYKELYKERINNPKRYSNRKKYKKKQKH